MVKKLISKHYWVFSKWVKRLITYRSEKMSSLDEFVEDIVCQISDIKENELKTFKLSGGEGEVLLVKQNNLIKALGTKCTHYGAPLEKGVLGNGRIRCPWHGACFNLSTGDIEDFPGLDSIPSYEVKIEGDNVKVKASKNCLSKNRRIKSMIGKNELSKESVIIIGGGPAAAVCAETLRQENFDGEITMICKEDVLPYDRVKCSKQMDFDINNSQLRTVDFYEQYNIKIITGKKVESVNTENKTLKLSNDDCLSYTKLFIATGSDPKKLIVPGEDLQNIFLLRNYKDASEINCALSKDKNMVIVGSGFTGMEVADYCVDKVKKITIAMRAPTVFNNVLGKEIGDALMNLLKEKGAQFIPDVNVKKFTGSEKVESIELTNGTTLQADIVVVCAGVAPTTNFLKNSGIEINSDGTITTNSKLQTNVPNVFVGGDIAYAPVWSHNNESAAIGHFGLAHYHGRIAGLNLAGKETELKTVPYFWTRICGLSIRYCGYGNFDEILYSGSVKDLKFLAIYIKNECVIAMSSCNMDPYVSKFAEFLAQGKKLTKGDVEEDTLAWAK